MKEQQRHAIFTSTRGHLLEPTAASENTSGIGNLRVDEIKRFSNKKLGLSKKSRGTLKKSSDYC